MYYRKDIMEKLGLSVPKTWEEFKHAATVIQRNNIILNATADKIAEKMAEVIIKNLV